MDAEDVDFRVVDYGPQPQKQKSINFLDAASALVCYYMACANGAAAWLSGSSGDIIPAMHFVISAMCCWYVARHFHSLARPNSNSNGE